MSPMKRLRMIRDALLEVTQDKASQLDSLERVAMTGMIRDLVEAVSVLNIKGDYQGRVELRKILGLPELSIIDMFGGVFRQTVVGGKTLAEYRELFKRAGIDEKNGLEGWVQEYDLSQTPELVQYVKVTGYQLGFNRLVEVEEMQRTACALGFSDCVREDGPALRCAYLDQPEGEMLMMAPDPPIVFKGREKGADKYGLLYIFLRTGPDTLVLGGEERMAWEPELPFIFRASVQPVSVVPQ
jgi:hypothetical protein